MIVLHHLDHSRSTRILWLLEELELSYELVRHEREPGFRAPASLRSVHPAGKAPVVELDGQLISESAVILTEIHNRHGAGRLTPGRETPDFLRHEEWLHFAEGSMAMPLVTTLYSRLTGGLPDGLGRIVSQDANAVLDRLETGVARGPYLLGKLFTLADIQIAYLIELASWLGVIGDRPNLASYLTHLQARPAYSRAIATGGPMMPN